MEIKMVGGIGSINFVGPIQFSGTITVGGGAPEWLPENAIAYADFANGNYYAGGSVVAVGDMIESVPENFMTANISASGYSLDHPTDYAGGAFKGAALASVLSGCSIVIEMAGFLDGTGSWFSLTLYDDPNFTTNWIVNIDNVIAVGVPQSSQIFDFGAININPAIIVPFGGSVSKVGVTFDTARLSLVIDGGTVATGANPLTLAAPNIFDFINSNPGQGYFVLKSITVYPTLVDAALQALTA